MISELTLIWQLEDLIDRQIQLASSCKEEELPYHQMQIEFLQEQVKIVKKQPLYDNWVFVDENDPPVDGRYIVYQKYEKDGYKEVSTAVWKNGQWRLDTGEYNVKYNSYTLRKTILAWAPLQTPPRIFEDIPTENYLEQRKMENEQALTMQ